MSKKKNWNTSVWGLRVIASKEAVENGIAKEGQRGILFGACEDLWKIVKEGTTTSSIYHKSFWDLAALKKD